MVNRSYFEINDSKFSKIKDETLKFVDIFETYFKNNVKCVYKFEDFMATLATHLVRTGYPMKKVEKWFIRINTNIQSMAKDVINSKILKRKKQMPNKKMNEEAGMSAGATATNGQGILSGSEDQTKVGVLGPTNFSIPVRIGEIRKRLLSGKVLKPKNN